MGALNTRTSTNTGRAKRMTSPPPTITNTGVTSTRISTNTRTARHHVTVGHGHSHGLVDRSIVRSRAGVRAVALSLGILAAAALAQALILTASGSVALLADLIHNVGDALTAIPLGIAFLLRSYRGEKLAGLAVVAVIFFSACVALYESIQRLLHPQTSDAPVGTRRRRCHRLHR